MLAESSYWYDLGRKELEEALHKPKVMDVAKNVIIFLGDGENMLDIYSHFCLFFFKLIKK